MKRQQKLTVKKVLKTILSASLALVLAIGLAFTPSLSVSAAGVEYINPGFKERITWTDEDQFKLLAFTVQTIDFYNIEIQDHCGTGTLGVYVYDLVNGVCILSHDYEIGEGSCVTDPMYLSMNEGYAIVLYYYIDESSYIGGDISLKVSKMSKRPQIWGINLGGTIESYFAVHRVEADSNYWLAHTPSTAGDHTIVFTGDLQARIYLYDRVGGGLQEYQDTIYFDNASGEWVTRNKVVFNITGDSLFLVQNYGETTDCKFGIEKNAKDVSDVNIFGTNKKFDSWSNINEDFFDYLITYTDGSSVITNYKGMCSWGLHVVTVSCEGNIYDINGDILRGAGQRTLTMEYNGKVKESTIDIQSITKWLTEDGHTPADVDTRLEAKSSDAGQNKYFLINVSKTGIYNFSSQYWEDLKSASLIVLDSRNEPVKYSDTAGGWPLIAGQDYALSLKFEFEENDAFDFYFKLWLEKEVVFPDADLNAWYGNAVTYAVGSGIMKGYDNGNFGTADGIQRQDFLVMLARLDGVDPERYEGYDTGFSDVQQGSYYDWAVAWGKQTGIVTGYDDGRFGVGDYITREQIVTFLCRYANYRGLYMDCNDNDYLEVANRFSDYSNISEFALDSVVWAVSNGVMNGKTSSTIVPQGNAQRCEVAQIMYNIFKNDVF